METKRGESTHRRRESSAQGLIVGLVRKTAKQKRAPATTPKSLWRSGTMDLNRRIEKVGKAQIGFGDSTETQSVKKIRGRSP